MKKKLQKTQIIILIVFTILYSNSASSLQIDQGISIYSQSGNLTLNSTLFASNITILDQINISGQNNSYNFTAIGLINFIDINPSFDDLFNYQTATILSADSSFATINLLSNLFLGWINYTQNNPPSGGLAIYYDEECDFEIIYPNQTLKAIDSFCNPSSYSNPIEFKVKNTLSKDKTFEFAAFDNSYCKINPKNTTLKPGEIGKFKLVNCKCPSQEGEFELYNILIKQGKCLEKIKVRMISNSQLSQENWMDRIIRYLKNLFKDSQDSQIILTGNTNSFNNQKSCDFKIVYPNQTKNALQTYCNPDYYIEPITIKIQNTQEGPKTFENIVLDDLKCEINPVNLTLRPQEIGEFKLVNCKCLPEKGSFYFANVLIKQEECIQNFKVQINTKN